MTESDLTVWGILTGCQSSSVTEHSTGSWTSVVKKNEQTLIFNVKTNVAVKLNYQTHFQNKSNQFGTGGSSLFTFSKQFAHQIHTRKLKLVLGIANVKSA